MLDSQPTADVTIDITAGGDVTTNPTSLTFTTSNWSTARTVTVSAGQDDDAVDDSVDITAHCRQRQRRRVLRGSALTTWT